MRVFGWIRPHFPEASDGILTSAGICEGFAGAGVGSGRAGFRRVRRARGRDAGHGRRRVLQAARRPRPAGGRACRGTSCSSRPTPDAELDELTGLYVSRGLSPDLARQVAIELTAHDALAAHAEAEYGITAASRVAPLRDALAVSAAFAAGAVLPWLAIVLIPGSGQSVSVTFVIVLAALALTGWVSARISQVQPDCCRWSARPASAALAMLITYFAGHLLHP